METELNIFKLQLKSNIEVAHAKTLKRIERSRKWRDTGSDKFNEFQFGKIFGMKDAYEHILQMINEIEEVKK